MRILCLDVGDRRVGVAVSDPGGTMAQPLLCLSPRCLDDLVASVARLVAQEGAGRVVVGMPLLADGARGRQARRTEAVVDALRRSLAVPVVTWDERFSTVEAAAALRQTGASRRRRRARLDQAAAAVILQSYLDACRPPAEAPEP